jgi:hypothetical protein
LQQDPNKAGSESKTIYALIHRRLAVVPEVGGTLLDLVGLFQFIHVKYGSDSNCITRGRSWRQSILGARWNPLSSLVTRCTIWISYSQTAADEALNFFPRGSLFQTKKKIKKLRRRREGHAP